MLDAVIDLSHHNQDADYAAIAGAGIRGVIYKATQGTTGIDPTYAAAESKARAAGLRWGAYHFGTGSDGVVQAQHFLAQISDPAEILMVLDFEPNLAGPTMTLTEAHAFVTHIHAATGRWPGLYSGHYIKQLLGTDRDPILANCWFWLAQYGATPVVPPCWPTWTMWQYSDGAINAPQPLPGAGHCDRNRFNGSMSQLEKLWRH